MINQQLLDYIRQQLQQGINEEQIKSALLTTGWQEPDINEGFRAININPPPIPGTPMTVSSSGKALKIALISLGGVVIIGGGIYVASQYLFNNEEQPEKNQLVQQEKEEIATDQLINNESVFLQRIQMNILVLSIQKIPAAPLWVKGSVIQTVQNHGEQR